MKYYELTLLISPDLSTEELNSFQERIISFIQAEKGILINQNKPTKQRLVCPIEKRGQAYLMTLNFQLNSENLENLERKIKAEDQILRYLILAKKVPKIAKITKKPSRFPKKISPKVFKPKVELKEIEKKLEEILGE